MSDRSNLLASLITILIAFLLVVASSLAAFILARSIAVRTGMLPVEFYRDSIVASSSIVIHLTLDRFLHFVWRSSRCLRAHAVFLIRKHLTRR